MTNWMTAAGIAFIAGGLATLISLRSVLFGGGRRARRRAATSGASAAALPPAPAPAAPAPAAAPAADRPARRGPGRAPRQRAAATQRSRLALPPAEALPGGLASIGLADEDDDVPPEDLPVVDEAEAAQPEDTPALEPAAREEEPPPDPGTGVRGNPIASYAPIIPSPGPATSELDAEPDPRPSPADLRWPPPAEPDSPSPDSAAAAPTAWPGPDPDPAGSAVWPGPDPDPAASTVWPASEPSPDSPAAAPPVWPPAPESPRPATPAYVPNPVAVTPGDEESRLIRVRRVDRADRRYGDRVDGWVRPEYRDVEPPSGEYWTPVPIDDLDYDLTAGGPEPSARGYGWPIPVERLPAVPDYEPATGFDLTPVVTEPTEVVPVWPPVPDDRADRIRLPRSWAGRNEKPAGNRFTDESPRTGNEADQRFQDPTGEPERRRPRPRPGPGPGPDPDPDPDPDNVYVSRHAADRPR